MPADYVFKPLEAQRERYAKCQTHRHQPVPSPRSERRIQPHYSPTALARCIRRVCDVLEIPRWSPNRLRHNAANRLRKEYGLDVVQVILGHSHADVPQVYAEADVKRALAAMERAG